MVVVADVLVEATKMKGRRTGYLDPPYWIQKYGHYSNCEDDLGNQSLAESTANFDRIA
jgi:hypothetical protein